MAEDSSNNLNLTVTAEDEAAPVLQQLAEALNNLTPAITQLSEAANTLSTALAGNVQAADSMSASLETVAESTASVNAVQEELASSSETIATAVSDEAAAADEAASAYSNLVTATGENVAQLELLAAAEAGAYDVQNQLMENSISLALGEDNVVRSFTEAVSATDELSAANEELNLSLTQVYAGMVGLQQIIPAETTELTDNALAADQDAASHDVLASAIEKIGLRFVAHAIIIGSVITAYQYLKGAIDDAETSSSTFKDAMAADTDATKLLQAQIGEALAPAIITVYNAVATFATELTNNKSAMNEFGQDAYNLANTLLALGQGFYAAFETAKTFVDNIVTSISLIQDKQKNPQNTAKDDAAIAANLSKSQDDLAQKLNASADAAAKYWDNVNNPTAYAAAVKAAGDFNNQLVLQTKTAAKLSTAIATNQSDYSNLSTNVTEDLQNLETAHDTAVTNIGNKLASLSQSYTDTQAAASQALTSLAEKNKSAMDSINQSITSVTNNIANLNASYANQQDTNTDTLVKALAKAEEDTKGGTANAQDEATLAAHADLVKQYQDQITAQEKYDTEGSLQQAIDDFNTKQAQDLTAYNTKLAQYQGEEAALQQKASIEQQTYNQEVANSKASYADKLAKISGELQATNLAYIDEATKFAAKESALTQLQNDAEKGMQDANNATKNLVLANVDQEIAKYKELEKELAAVNKAQSAGAVGTAVGGYSPVPPKLYAAGGIVDEPTLAIVGESGPEAIIPLTGNETSGTQQLPANLGGGGSSTIIVNLTVNGSVATQNDLVTWIGQALTQELKNSFAVVGQ